MARLALGHVLKILFGLGEVSIGDKDVGLADPGVD